MISIAVAIFFLLFKRRLPPGTNDSTSANSELPQKFRGTEFYELQNSSIIQELHDGRTLPELASRVKQ
jgi:hypothetical protein